VRGSEPREAEALLSEAQIAGGLQHPNVVPVYDLGLDDGKHSILLMKRVEGHT
jgi:serine/threonine-protein kinase